MTFLDRDGKLLELDAHERSITHKLAEYLQDEFPEWNVDCEYNRDRSQPKALIRGGIDNAQTVNKVTVFPDIVIHRRDSSENLVVIEAKKRGSENSGWDLEKLNAYKEQMGYQFAYMTIFPVGPRFHLAAVQEDIIEVSGD